MKQKIELLAPGGDIDSIKAAIAAGADAIYCGLDNFNARNRAGNLTFDDLHGVLRLAHKNDCQIFLTLNIIIVESELPALFNLLNRLVNSKIDGVIVQDIGLFYLLTNYFPNLNVHASTQATTHNVGQLAFLKKLSATRVNLCRELSLPEIDEMTRVSHEHHLETEVFVHGSNCIGFSGICYMSSVNGGNSGNRGNCSQPCRDQYQTTEAGGDFPLNLKDNSAYDNLGELSAAGVDSIKIEGRMKKFHYVYTVVNALRKHLDNFYLTGKLDTDNADLHRVFNRDFTNGFLKSDIGKDMFIDNPRDNSAKHFSEITGGGTDWDIERFKKEIYDARTEIINRVKGKIDPLSIEKAPLDIVASGCAGEPLNISITTPESSFIVRSKSGLVQVKDDGESGQKMRSRCLGPAMLLKRFAAINDSEYFIRNLDMGDVANDLYLPYREITLMKKQILSALIDDREFVDPIELPKLTTLPIGSNKSEGVGNARLSLLIASRDDLTLCNETSADIYFQLPDSFKDDIAEFLDLFRNNRRVIPWFPPVIIGEDYRVAIEFLRQLKPVKIVTNNAGIAFEASQQGIDWIAGPHLNIVNSFGLICLKEIFSCSGAFISNEISKGQIKKICRPDDFELHYSIYHPIVLMTSRQCLFHQVTGCEKSVMDDSCIPHCEKSASITNMKGGRVKVEKSKGNYHCLHNDSNFLNTDIVTDLPDQFASFFVDLRDIETETEIGIDKLELVQMFERHLSGDSDAAGELKKAVHPTTNTQYVKGV